MSALQTYEHIVVPDSVASVLPVLQPESAGAPYGATAEERYGTSVTCTPSDFTLGNCPISAPRKLDVESTVSGSMFGAFVHSARFRPMREIRPLCARNAEMKSSGSR